ncbi:protein ENHANCED DOWNY MILDEW 2 isoform X2 [Physcomitrium patens]|uniref:protein ENHANCED DOWNY MILDEW 2 isoform X2 n=1 Tax=Physcomitrium patens TaxID=3218 RepID=UPI000D15CB9F|nr:uncharacterized protein LOC112285981 isoform X2 [Physcomitrium patens]|eukprot:XP_024383187.1 uncharacterized protein LOC112285981 isoform X2 [Physcomitrella patens]
METVPAIDFFEDFFLTSGDKYPSLMQLPFAIREIQWERSQAEKVYVQGKFNGLQEVSVEIDLWKLELPIVGKPKFLIHEAAGAWIELRKPRDFYLETMKVVIVAAHFLIFAKQSPESTKGAVWRYIRKECSEFKVKPNQKDLSPAFLLLQAIVTSDPKLQASSVISQFFPKLFKKWGPRSAKVRERSMWIIFLFFSVGSDADAKRLRVKRESSPVSEALKCEGLSNGKNTSSNEVESPSLAYDSLNGEPSSQSMRRMRSLAEFAVEADLPLSKRLTPVPKKRKPGRPARGNSFRKGKRSAKLGGDEDWADEPDVCVFCDDGVEGSQRLLCCDGPCMRSFHPTIDSGLQNKCKTLRLTRAAISVETWICPNCEVGQHQCFACGKLGKSTESADEQEVFVCDHNRCRRFYHPACVAKLLVSEAAQNNLACRIQLKLETFTCPLHKCANCNLDENKIDPTLHLVKCRRCPVAWHEKCLPQVCRSQIWPLADGKCVMYCGKHRLDPELLTPERNHITFPAGSKYSESLLSYEVPASDINPETKPFGANLNVM